MSIAQKTAPEATEANVSKGVSEQPKAILNPYRFVKLFDPVRMAKLISLALHPFLIAPLSIILVLYLDRGQFWVALAWAALCAAFVVLPALIYLYGKLKRKQYSDSDVSVQEQRHSFYLFGGLCMVICFAMLLWLDAPPLLIKSFIAALAAIGVSAVVTRFWLKVSIHTGVMAGVTTMVVFYSTSLALSFALGTLLVIWSRLILKRHTRSEAILGGVIGASCVLIVFLLGLWL